MPVAFGAKRAPASRRGGPDDLAERDALRSDGDINSAVVGWLKTHAYTKDVDIEVDVKQAVVILVEGIVLG
jgi:hypothetical protein